jgi:serine/threonine protein kinase
LGRDNRPSVHITEKGEGEGDGEACVLGLWDAFANVRDGTVSLMLEYMDGGSLQDMANNVRTCRHSDIVIQRHAIQNLSL